VDLELLLPSTSERAFVQIKSQANAASLRDYATRFEQADIYDRMFFVWHSGGVAVLAARVAPPLGILKHARVHPDKYPWLIQLLARRPAKVAAVALANKMAPTVQRAFFETMNASSNPNPPANQTRLPLRMPSGGKNRTVPRYSRGSLSVSTDGMCDFRG
jgi:hypothetical protein